MKSSCLGNCLAKIIICGYFGFLISIGLFYVHSYKQDKEHEKFIEAEQAQCDAKFADMILPKLDYLPDGVKNKPEVNTRLVRQVESWEVYSCWLYISYPKYGDADIDIIFVDSSEDYLTEEWSCRDYEYDTHVTECRRGGIIIDSQFDIETTQLIAEGLYFDSD